jgi:hemoglobin-like flavoprotein
MTPEQVVLVEASWRKAAPQLDVLVADFYRRLFLAAPSVRGLFPDDMTEQRAKLATMLATVVAGLRDHDAFVGHLSALGRRHVAYGVQAAHYPIVGNALLDALGAALGTAWDAATQQAWRAAYDLMSEVMLSAAVEASTGVALL